MRRAAIVALLLLGVVGTLQAYTPSASGTGVTPVFQRWFNVQTSYLVNDQTTANLPNVAAGSDPLTAVARGFQAWEDVAPATIIANFAGLTQIKNAASDGNNVVSFVDQSFSFNGALAVTLRFINPSTGQVGSADIIFNPAIPWSTKDPGQGVFDVQQVATHEAGHFFALDHSGLMNATMYATSGSQAQLERRLDPDDVAGLADTYPRDSLTTDYGTITGRVTRLGSNVFGGQVVAVELGSGRPVVSALTLRDGTYQIRGVPPGSYQLYVEPLDQPTSQGNVAGYWQSQTFTLFQSTIHGPLIEIEAGETVSVDIAVPSPAPGLNPRLIGLRVRGGGILVTNSLIPIRQGEIGIWDIVVAGEGMTSPTTFQVTGPGVTRVSSFAYGTFTSGTPFALASFDVSADATPAPRVVLVQRSGETAMMSGGVEILPDPPELTIRPDPLLPGLLVEWYGGNPPYLLRRDTHRDFSAPVLLYNANDLQFRDGNQPPGADLYYRVDDN